MRSTTLLPILLGQIVILSIICGSTQASETTQVPANCEAADALRDAGYFEDAKTEYIELLKGEVKPKCAISGLVSVKELESGGKVLLIWRGFLSELGFWVRPILEIMAAVIVLMVIKKLREQYLNLRIRRRARPALSIEEFDSSEFDPEPMGKGFSSVIRSQLERMAAGSQRGRIFLVTGPIEAIPIPPEVEAIVPTTPTGWLSPITLVKAILALINWLSPSRTMKLTGWLHKPGNRGVGLTVHLIKNSEIHASYTFWQKDFDDFSEYCQDNKAASLYQLAEYAAIWLIFKTTEQKFGSDFKLLGTNNWRTYAYFRAGFYAEKQGRTNAAKNLYVTALQLDSKVRGARINLARLLRNENVDMAIEHLLQVKKDCVDVEDEKTKEDGERDPTLYSSLYSLAALLYNKKKDVHGAIIQTFDLITRIKVTLEKIKYRKEGYEDKDGMLKKHLETIYLTTHAMLGGFLAEVKAQTGVKNWLEESADNAKIHPSSSIIPRHQYNLGCSYSVLAQYEPQTQNGEKNREQYLKDSLRHLERAFQIRPDLVHRSEEDHSLRYVSKEKADKYQKLIRDAFRRSARATEQEKSNNSINESRKHSNQY